MDAFMREGIGLTAIGVAFGLGVAALLTRGMESLLFGVQPLDRVDGAAWRVRAVEDCCRPRRTRARLSFRHRR